jgi:hypothetical protein
MRKPIVCQVARTLGHVDTTMVYRTYGCYIPHLTRQDGLAFERQYAEALRAEALRAEALRAEALRAEALRAEATKKGSPNRHNFRHNDQNLGSFSDVNILNC